MKRLYTLAMVLAAFASATAQTTSLSIETVMEHDGAILPEGYTTYRVYANMTSELDFVSAVYGTDTNPLMLGCDGEIYQSTDVNYNFGNEVSVAFFPVFPTTQYDSWLTIGTDDAMDGVYIQNTDGTMAPALAMFNAGEGFVINDPFGASWFNVFPCVSAPDLAACAAGNPAFAGADLKVLLAQITATGDVYGLFNTQVFPGGVQINESQNGLTFSSDPTDVFGCTNPAATNYDAAANIDDLSCTLPCIVALQVDNVVSPSCNGDNDALIQVSVTGAQGADFFYKNSLTATAQNFGNFPNLVADTYTIYVVDGAGCIDSLDVVVPETEVVSVQAVVTSPVTCHNDGNAVLSVTSTSGGNGEYQYYISNNPTVLVDNPVWSNLNGGQTYTVYAVDGNQCTGNSSPILITNPTAITVGYQTSPTASVVDASCFNVEDGEIYVVALGGAAPATLQFTVDGVNYSGSPLIVSGGTYTVTAQDINGCTGTLAGQVVVGPDAIVVNATSSPEACFGEENGEITWSPSGGAGGYSYVFNGSETTVNNSGDLAPGTYVLEVTDADGCTEESSITVEAGVEIVTTSTVVDVSCFGENDGEVTLAATGGTGSFQYSDDGNNYAGNPNFDNLLAGSYTFFVQDENGCVQQASATIDEPGAIVVTGIVSEGSVTGEGTIDVTVTGGNLPYTYEWIGPGVSGQDGQDLEGISSGSYTVEVTDANGCSTTQTFNITTDISELAAGMTARVYPNPSAGEFQVVLEGGYQGLIGYQVVDAQGRLVSNGQWVVQPGQFNTQIDLSSVHAGMYRLVLVSERGTSSIQLVKSH
ncbi:MAG: T9SS type A sorting domain-containing protein [Bacteroidetes bacterium]|nr:T9SS type A sorting domain-containing protein [Bacteroidota bacterium]MDA0902780.1 T9SS type A sorting domain-containing protein [Bacteroidota bacterium]MDA1243072.1 T9SS type A sorting domain-containing protein [Bacteroidota bacterium]